MHHEFTVDYDDVIGVVTDRFQMLIIALCSCVFQGKSGDRVGFFPANFVQRVRPGERVWRVIQDVPGNRERGHMAVKESQVSKYYHTVSFGFSPNYVPHNLNMLLLLLEDVVQ